MYENQEVGESMPSSGICLGLSMTIAQVGTGVSQGAVMTSTLDRAPLGTYFKQGLRAALPHLQGPL